MDALVLMALAYLLGSIPFGLLVSRVLGAKDLRGAGSGNIGATNAYRVAGKLAGFFTLVLDIAKGIIVILLSQYWFPNLDTYHFAAATVALIGHIFPIWLGFKGGKGVATAFGILIILAPQLWIMALIVWVLMFTVYRIVSLASIFAAIAVLLTIWVGISADWLHYNHLVVLMLNLMILLIIFKHRENIIRLLAGSEKKL